MRSVLISLLLVGLGQTATAQALSSGDAELGKQIVGDVCSACHGANGISISDDIPNLAGQKAPYLIKQLTNFRAGDRSSPFMEPIAESLSDEDIANLAAFLSDLPHDGGTDTAAAGNSINAPQLELPEDYEGELTEYLRKNGDDGGQKLTRIFKANQAAIDAMREGRPFPDGALVLLEAYLAELDNDGNEILDDNGVRVPGEFTGIIAQGIDAEVAQTIPETLRNGNWVMGSYGADRQHRDANLAKCYACHKAQDDSEHLFQLEALQGFAQK